MNYLIGASAGLGLTIALAIIATVVLVVILGGAS